MQRAGYLKDLGDTYMRTTCFAASARRLVPTSPSNTFGASRMQRPEAFLDSLPGIGKKSAHCVMAYSHSIGPGSRLILT